MDRNRRLATLAGRRRGVVTRAELLVLGFSESTVDRWLREGRLHRLFRGVYFLGHPVPPPLARETAALLATGPTAALGHHTGLYLDGLLPQGHTIHVVVPDRRCRPQPGLQPHHSPLPAHEVHVVHGLRVTKTARALRDVRASLDPDLHERITNEAEVQGLIPRRPGPGVTKRELEHRFRLLLRRARITPTATNTHRAGYEVDVLFEEARLVVELDGYQFHRTRHAFEHDRRKDQALIAAGFRVMRVTWHQVTQAPEELLVRLVRALGATAV